MKKRVPVLLSVFSLAFAFAACGTSTQTDNKITPTSEAIVTEAPALTEAPTVTEEPAAPTEAVAPTQAATPISTATTAPAPTEKPDISEVSLKELYQDDFMIGTIYTSRIESGPDCLLVTQHFDIITPENLMKPEYMQPKEGTLLRKAVQTL